MVHYFYGEDVYAAREEIGDLAKRQGAAIRWLDRESLEKNGPAEVLARGSSGLFGKELIVIQDAHTLPRGLQDDLVRALEVAGASAECVVWGRGEPDKRTGLYKKLRESGRVFAALPAREAVQWLVAEAERRGGEIESGAAHMLVDRLGGNRWRLINELEKLLLRSEHITTNIVDQAVVGAESAEIFAMLDALVRRDRRYVVRSLIALLEEGDNEFYILSMLAYQFRTLLIIRTGIDQGKTRERIISQGDLKPYAVQKNYSYAQRFSRTYLRGALTRILATDFAIRRGKVDQRTAVLMLVLSLASPVGRDRGRASDRAGA